MSIRISWFHHCLFPTSVHTSLLYMGVSIPALPIGSSICTIFLDSTLFVEFHIFHIFSRFHDICFSLSDSLNSVGQTLGPSTSLQKTQFHSFIWLSNIPLFTSLSTHLSMGFQVISITLDFCCTSLSWTLGQQHLYCTKRCNRACSVSRRCKSPQCLCFCAFAHAVALHCPDCPSYSHAEILSLFKA